MTRLWVVIVLQMSTILLTLTIPGQGLLQGLLQKTSLGRTLIQRNLGFSDVFTDSHGTDLFKTNTCTIYGFNEFGYIEFTDKVN